MSKKRRAYPRPPPDPSHLLLTAQITFIYFLLLGLLVFLTTHYGIPLDQRIFPVLPLDWGHFLKGFIYGVPPVLALLYGWILRPFWTHFRDLLIAVLMIHLFYSVLTFGFRELYLNNRTRVLAATRFAALKAFSRGHTFHDLDKDGRIDRVRFQIQVDAREFPEGEYLVYAWLTHKGQSLADAKMGYVKLDVKKDAPEALIHFQVDPQPYEPYFAGGTFEVNIGLRKILPFDAEGEQVIAWNRWAPFLRTASWEGKDPGVESAQVNIDEIHAVDVFALMPLKMLKPQVVFRRFLGEEGVDLDHDGLWDALDIRFEVDSHYEGPVYAMAGVEGSDFPLFDESSLEPGRQQMTFRIRAADIQHLGFDGPYHLVDIQLFNQNPGCPSEACIKRIKPFFRTYLDNYYTKAYTLADFNPK